jgi:hypothetical protein
MREPVRQRALAVTAGGVVGSGVGLGMSQVVQQWELAVLAGAFWLVGAALFVLGYHRLSLPAESAPEQPWWKVTTRRGWVWMVVLLTIGMGVFYALVARALTVPATFEVWLTVSMASMGPTIAGIIALLGAEGDSPFVEADEESAA